MKILESIVDEDEYVMAGFIPNANVNAIYAYSANIEAPNGYTLLSRSLQRIYRRIKGGVAVYAPKTSGSKAYGYLLDMDTICPAEETQEIYAIDRDTEKALSALSVSLDKLGLKTHWCGASSFFPRISPFD